ncbi:MAG: hypothetical protein ACJ71P_10085 [Nitrososphaeraceae archaeon]
MAATLRLIDDIKKYNKIYGLKRELERLSLQKFAINEACSGQSRTMMALLSLQAHGMTEQQIIAIKNFLANNEYNIDMKPNG